MSLKITHLSMFNNSGMHNSAKSLVAAEQKLGLDSHLVNMHETSSDALDATSDSDIFVAHTHFPNEVKKRATKKYKLVFPVHGTIEHIFRSAVESGGHGYGSGDGLMLFMHWLNKADAIVTSWERHQTIIQSMVNKNTKIHYVEMGIEKDFWCAGPSDGKWAGTPSVFTAENCHEIKWPLDLFIAWPFVYENIPDACLHACYLPNDVHRYFFPLVNANGASFGAHISPLAFHGTALRNVFRSVDFVTSFVRYGDHNRLNLEAEASGAKTISYSGNVYSDWWIPEGDQRIMADHLVKIMRGEVEPRADKREVPDIAITAEGMKAIYDSLF